MKRPKVRPDRTTIDPVNYERDIAPFTRRSENLLREIRQELSTIPEYRNAAFIAGKSTREPTRVDPLFDMITALKRGIRSVQGKESKSSLQDRERKLENIIRKAQEYKGAALMRTPGGGRATLVTGLRPDEMSKGGRVEIKGNKFKGTF